MLPLGQCVFCKGGPIFCEKPPAQFRKISHYPRLADSRHPSAEERERVIFASEASRPATFRLSGRARTLLPAPVPGKGLLAAHRTALCGGVPLRTVESSTFSVSTPVWLTSTQMATEPLTIRRSSPVSTSPAPKGEVCCTLSAASGEPLACANRPFHAAVLQQAQWPAAHAVARAPALRNPMSVSQAP